VPPVFAPLLDFLSFKVSDSVEPSRVAPQFPSVAMKLSRDFGFPPRVP